MELSRSSSGEDQGGGAVEASLGVVVERWVLWDLRA